MSKLLRNTILGIAVAGFSQTAISATINATALVPTNPDIGGAIHAEYKYIAPDAGQEYIAPILNGGGKVTEPGQEYIAPTAGSGALSVTAASTFGFDAVYVDNTGVLVDDTAFTDLLFNANFDENGGFLGGDFSINVQTGFGDQIVDFGNNVLVGEGETLLAGTLDAFGFFGNGAQGFLEFEYSITDGYWFDNASSYEQTGGIILNVLMDTGASAGSWDADTELFKRDWAAITAGGGDNNINAFTTEIAVVPVPAAAWLFGSGLIGLYSIARAKRFKA